MADVWIASQQLVDPPTDIDVSEDVVVTLRKVLHNDGPYGPVEVEIETWATAPQDCTAAPGTGNLTSASLPVSANVVIDETWTIHCDARSQHVFSFENHIEDPAVADPDLGNNFASAQLTVDVWDQADLNMIDQYVEDPPAGGTIPLGENVEIWVLTRVKNDGPFGGVDAVAETSATAPAGCDVSPSIHAEEIGNLGGLVVTVKARFFIRCDEPGWHRFSFDNTITVDQQHVRDPDAGNDTVHTELTVTVTEP